MVKIGYYPLERIDLQTASMIGSMYRIVPEDRPRISEYKSHYRVTVQGKGQSLYRQ